MAGIDSDTARRRVEYQAVGGALAQLDAANPQAALIIAGLTRAVVAEAQRSSRFAASLTDAVIAALPAGDFERTPAAAPATRAPATRAATTRKRAVRQPGAFDPFTVYRDSGADGLTSKLTGLDVDGLRDIIAEQELDTRKETGRKRKPEVLVAWIVERVEASERKGSVFR